MKLELAMAKPFIPLGLGVAKNLIQVEVDEKQGYLEPFQNVADNVTGTIPFAVGVANMFLWKSTWGDVVMGSGGAFVGEALTKLVRKYTKHMARRGGVTLELETSSISPMPTPQVSEVDRIHGVVV